MYVATLVFFEFWHSFLGEGILIRIYSGINLVQMTALSCTLLMVPSKEDIFFWLSISNGCFGLGNVMAPLIVDLFQLHTFTA